MRCTMSMDISAPSEVVWQITQNPERRKDWDYRITESKQLSTGSIGKNTRCSVTGNLGITYYLEYKYILYQHGKKTAIKVIDCKGAPISGGGGGWTYEVLDEQTCRFHLNIVLELKSFPFSNLIDRIFFGPAFRWMSRKSLIKLKAIAEEEFRTTNSFRHNVHGG